MAKSGEAPLVRMADLEIDPAQLDAYNVLLTEEIAASVALEAGVLALNAVSTKGRPEQICILEVYADEASYEAHLRSPHFLKYKTMTAGMVRSLRLLEVNALILRAKDGAGNWP